MIHESKSGYIFTNCECCNKKLNDLEKDFCDNKTVETGFYHQICSNCLDVRYNGQYPAVS